MSVTTKLALMPSRLSVPFFDQAAEPERARARRLVRRDLRRRVEEDEVALERVRAPARRRRRLRRRCRRRWRGASGAASSPGLRRERAPGAPMAQARPAPARAPCTASVTRVGAPDVESRSRPWRRTRSALFQFTASLLVGTVRRATASLAHAASIVALQRDGPGAHEDDRERVGPERRASSAASPAASRSPSWARR